MGSALPVCKTCGQPINGNYLVTLGATWHPEHFLCAGCHQPIRETNFQVHQSAPYHDACYIQNIASRCVYCNKPLVEYQGGHLVMTWQADHWGNNYCKEHEQQYPACSSCGRLVPPWQQAPTASEAGITCPVCRASAIEDIAEAKPLFNQVKRWVSNQGLVYNNLPLSLELCGRARLATLLQERHSQALITHARGATVSVTYMLNNQAIRTEVSGVAVLRGLPALLFQGVTVHELGHVWLIVHGVQPLPVWAEEGFCELLSYRFYSEQSTPESTYHATNIERNIDPIYGEGFRRVRAIADTIGFPRFLETMRITKQLPR